MVAFCLGVFGLLWAQESEVYCDEEGHCWYQGDGQDAEGNNASMHGGSADQDGAITGMRLKESDVDSYYSDDPYSREIRAEDRYEREKIRMQEERAREERMSSKVLSTDRLSSGTYNQKDIFDKTY